jgi:hypothetical protein
MIEKSSIISNDSFDSLPVRPWRCRRREDESPSASNRKSILCASLDRLPVNKKSLKVVSERMRSCNWTSQSFLAHTTSSGGNLCQLADCLPRTDSGSSRRQSLHNELRYRSWRVQTSRPFQARPSSAMLLKRAERYVLRMIRKISFALVQSYRHLLKHSHVLLIKVDKIPSELSPLGFVLLCAQKDTVYIIGEGNSRYPKSCDRTSLSKRKLASKL